MRYLLLIRNYLCVLMLLAPMILLAQPTRNSPYSRFGIGDIHNRNFNLLQNMGDLGAAYNDPYYLNISNPASYSFLKATAFDIGVHADYTTISDENATQNSWSGNLSYLSLAFPLQNFISDALERIDRKYEVAMGFALLPYSNVGYNISSVVPADVNPEIGEYTNNFQGSGGTYQFLSGASVKHKNISFGLQAGYLFGRIEYQKNLFFDNLIGGYNNFFKNAYSVNGFLYRAGLMYSHTLNKSAMENNKSVRARRITFGLYGNGNTSFNTDNEILEESIQNVLGNVGSRDTARIDTIQGTGTLPAEFGIGFLYEIKEKFGVGVNFSFANWSSYRNDAQEESLENTFKASFGGFFRPDSKSYNNYLKRIIYRYGVFYQTDPRSVDAIAIKNYGVTFGFGLPFIRQRKISHANLGFTFGNKGQGTAIEESYLRMSFSFTFNDDEWFIKRKYN